MRLEVELHGAPDALSGYLRISCMAGSREAQLSNAPPSSVIGAVEKLTEQIESLVSPEERQLLEALGTAIHDD